MSYFVWCAYVEVSFLGLVIVVTKPRSPFYLVLMMSPFYCSHKQFFYCSINYSKISSNVKILRMLSNAKFYLNDSFLYYIELIPVL